MRFSPTFQGTVRQQAKEQEQILSHGLLHSVPGVLGVKPILRGVPLSIRPSRKSGYEAIQLEQPITHHLEEPGVVPRVVAVGLSKEQILTFANINHLPCKNYSQEPELRHRPDENCVPEAITLD